MNAYLPKQNKYILIGYLEEDDDYCMGCHMGHFYGDFFIDGKDEHGEDPQEIADQAAMKLAGQRGKYWQFYIIFGGRIYELNRCMNGECYFGIPEIDQLLDQAIADRKAYIEEARRKQKEEDEREVKEAEKEQAKWQLEQIRKEHPELLKGE